MDYLLSSWNKPKVNYYFLRVIKENMGMGKVNLPKITQHSHSILDAMLSTVKLYFSHLIHWNAGSIHLGQFQFQDVRLQSLFYSPAPPPPHPRSLSSHYSTRDGVGVGGGTEGAGVVVVVVRGIRGLLCSLMPCGVTHCNFLQILPGVLCLFFYILCYLLRILNSYLSS